MIRTLLGSVALSLGLVSTPVFASSTASLVSPAAGISAAESSIKQFAPDVLLGAYSGVPSTRLENAVMPAEGVPEPSDIGLVSIGLVALALGRKLRKRSNH